MAKVEGIFYEAQRLRRGSTPTGPQYDGSEGQPSPVNPTTSVTPPVAIRYTSEANMIAGQINQRSGYLYYDGTNTWWYKGIANGLISDYILFGAGGGGGYPEAIEIETNTVPFDNDYIIGNAAARTGDILFDFTDAKLGAVTMMSHNDTVDPTLPGSAIVVGGYYIPNEINYIYFNLTNKTVSSERVLVTFSAQV